MRIILCARSPGNGLRLPLALTAAYVAVACGLFPTVLGQEGPGPVLNFNPISVQLESTGTHRITSDEIAQLSAGSAFLAGVTELAVKPEQLTFCDVGYRVITLTLTDVYGHITNRQGPIEVLAPKNAPLRVYVDASYSPACGAVGFPASSPKQYHLFGFDAFPTVQAAIDHVTPGGVVYVAPATYVENLTIDKPLFLVGPNAGMAGLSLNRKPEARIVPARSDPESAPIVSVESDDVVIDGLLLDGHNPQLTGGYDANGVRVHAAAGVQNGTYPDLADVEGITIRNNIITNISYDGICLDRYQYFGTSSAWNYIRNNYLVNMWEGMLTYSLDAVIADNIVSNVTHGIGVHCVTTAPPKGFTPVVASNLLWVAQWWPVEIIAARAPGIWINFRWDDAAPLDVVGNVIHTPQDAPSLKTIVGLYALTIERGSKVRFLDNTVDGQGHCTVGFLAASCWSNQAVMVSGGAIKGVRTAGVLADTLDARWGAGDSFVTLTNVNISGLSGGMGVLAVQQTTTADKAAGVQLLGSTRISGAGCGVQVRGSNAWACVVGQHQSICGNLVGIDVDGGRALIEGSLLTNNYAAGITVENGGIVDAGDCDGGNVTGLGTGSGPNGSSAGSNDLSGYGCDRKEPWAIRNESNIPVLADRNFLNVRPGEDINAAVSGPVRFSDAGALKVVAPVARQVECLSEVPPGAETAEQFVAAGGLVTAGAISAVAFHDTVVLDRPGAYTVFRDYSLKGGCSQTATCQQRITAVDNQPPKLLCSGNIIQAVDRGCDYATVTFTNIATDSCGELLGLWAPVCTGRFPIGTNTIVVIATDLAQNSSVCTFDVAVVTSLVVPGAVHLRVLECGNRKITLEISGHAAVPFCLMTSTNLVDWTGLTTSMVPFTYTDTKHPLEQLPILPCTPGALMMITTSIVAALAGLGFSLILIRMALRPDWNDRWTRRGTDWHHAESPVPRLGGAILVCWFLGLVSWVTVFHPALGAATPEQHSIVIASISMFALGFWDDLHPIGPGKKLFVRVLIAVGAYWGGLELVVVKTPFSAAPLQLGLWGPIVTVVWLIAVPNLINLVDGYDGLAGGIALTSMFLLGVIAHGHGILDLVAFGIVGALLGFLRYNFPPARIYLGDGGAYFLGFLIAALALANAEQGIGFHAMGATMVLLSVPLADATFTVLRRGVRGLPLLRPDRRHLHHRLLGVGRSRQEPLLWVYGLNLVLFALGLMIYFSPPAGWLWCLGATVSLLLILAGCCRASPPYLGIWTKIRSCWRMRGQVRYALSLVRWLELEGKTAKGPGDLWPDLIFTADKLGLAGVTFKRNLEQRRWRKTAGLSGPVRSYPLGNGRYGILELEAAACVRGKSEPNAECQAEGACHFGRRGCLLEPRVLDTITELIAEAWNKAATQWQARQRPSGCGAPRRSFAVSAKAPHKYCAKAAVLLVLICLLPWTVSGGPLLDTNYFARKLRAVTRPELPARAGALVRQATPQLRSATAVQVVRIAALINPMAVANIVCEVSRADPGSVTAIAQAATREQPDFATDIARAATVAVPLRAREIMAGVGNCVPDGLRDVAVAIAVVAPSASREIVLAVASIRSDLKPHLETELNLCGTRIPSVGRCLDRAELALSGSAGENARRPSNPPSGPALPPRPRPPRGGAQPPGGRNYAKP